MRITMKVLNSYVYYNESYSLCQLKNENLKNINKVTENTERTKANVSIKMAGLS